MAAAAATAAALPRSKKSSTTTASSSPQLLWWLLGGTVVALAALFVVPTAREHLLGGAPASSTSSSASLALSGAAKCASAGDAAKVQKCITSYLESNDGQADSRAWVQLGIHLASSAATTDANNGGGSALVSGVAHQEKDCYLKAIAANRKNPEAWFNLGAAMPSSGPGRTIDVGGKPFTKRLCYLRTLKLDPRHANAWFNIAVSLTNGVQDHVKVGGKPYTQIDAYVQVVELSPQHAVAWFSLGALLEPPRRQATPVNGKVYTQLDCYKKALELDPSFGYAWFSLGMVLPSPAAAVHEDEVEGNNRVKEVTIFGKPYDRIQAFVRALEADDRMAEAWYYLGTSMLPRLHVMIKGKQYFQRALFLKTLELDPDERKFPIAYAFIASTMSKTETVAIGSSKLSQRQCYLKALDGMPGNTLIWEGLGKSMAPGETVRVQGKEYSYDEVQKKGKKYA